METNPVPIVIVSGSSTAEELSTTFHALESGALAVVRRPVGIAHPHHEGMARELIQTVKLMSEVKVVRRWPQTGQRPAGMEGVSLLKPAEVGIVAIGASTGGPIAIQTILSRLPRQFQAPILIVQHMAQGFVHGFAEWLQHSTKLRVSVASHGEVLLPGHVYIAPDGHHTRVSGTGRVLLDKGEHEGGHRPAVAVLFRSVAEAFGPRAIGVLLTGMGKDGSEELALLKDRGATTLVQKPETCVVAGMPGEAVRRGAAVYVLSPEGIAEAMAALVKGNSPGKG